MTAKVTELESKIATSVTEKAKTDERIERLQSINSSMQQMYVEQFEAAVADLADLADALVVHVVPRGEEAVEVDAVLGPDELGERRAHEKMAPKGSGNSGDDEKDKKTAASGYAQMYVPTLCDLVATAEFNTIAVEIDAGIDATRPAGRAATAAIRV